MGERYRTFPLVAALFQFHNMWIHVVSADINDDLENEEDHDSMKWILERGVEAFYNHVENVHQGVDFFPLLSRFIAVDYDVTCMCERDIHRLVEMFELLWEVHSLDETEFNDVVEALELVELHLPHLKMVIFATSMITDTSLISPEERHESLNNEWVQTAFKLDPIHMDTFIHLCNDSGNDDATELPLQYICGPFHANYQATKGSMLPNCLNVLSDSAITVIVSQGSMEMVVICSGSDGKAMFAELLYTKAQKLLVAVANLQFRGNRSPLQPSHFEVRNVRNAPAPFAGSITTFLVEKISRNGEVNFLAGS